MSNNQIDWAVVREELVEWVKGGKTITSYSMQEGKPNRSTITKRLRTDKEFAQEVEAAKEEGADVLVERTLKILKMEPKKDRFGRIDNGFVQWAKFQAEHSMRIAGLWSSKYSPKKQVEHTGGVTFQVITGVPEPKSEIEFKAAKILDVKVGTPEKVPEGDADADS